MKKERNSNSWLIIAFILVCLVAVLGIIGTIYFYNKSLDDNVEDKPSVEDNNNVNDEAWKFTFLEEYIVTENDSKDVIVGNKTLKFKIINNQLYLNDKKIVEGSKTFKIYLTNKFIIVDLNAGMFGAYCLFFDYNGERINLSYDFNRYQFRDLELKNNKLMVSVRDVNEIVTEGHIVGNLHVHEFSDGCNKKLKDYPDFIQQYKDIILDADYYFEYNNYEIDFKIDKVNLTVGDLSEDVCVDES